MTKHVSTAKAEVLQHINAALKVSFRDDALRATLQAAAALAQPQTAAGRSHLEYENLAPGGKLTCKAHPGLVMRCAKSTGIRSWFFRYRDTIGKEKHMPIGTFPDTSLSAARAKVEELRIKHKMGELDAFKEPAPVYNTADLCEQFLTEYALGTKIDGSPVKRSGQQDARLLRKYIVPNYGQMPAAEFDADTLRPILSSLATTAPREAMKLRAVVSTMFNVACGRTRKITYLNGTWLPAGHLNPADGAAAPLHKAKSFCPTADQLRTFVDCFATATHGSALMLQLLTMTRVSEVVQAAWAEFDLDNAQWHLPAERSKNGHGYTIQLPAQAVALLRDIKANQTTGSAYLFPAPRSKQDKPIRTNNVLNEVTRIRAAADLPSGFSTHAMRHAGLTWLKENLCPLDIRNAITNHCTRSADEKVDSGYTTSAKFDAHARQWLQKWADHIDALQGRNVLRIRHAG